VQVVVYQLILLVVVDLPAVVLYVPKRERGFVTRGVDYGVDVVEVRIVFEDDASRGQEFLDDGLPCNTGWWLRTVPAGC